MICPRCLRQETTCMTVTTACAHCGHPWHPVCTCDVRGAEYDDVTFDPACVFHGDEGSMVATLPRQRGSAA